ncbi:RcnB family protein [Pseudomonas sp. Marseille-QA0892]
MKTTKPITALLGALLIAGTVYADDAKDKQQEPNREEYQNQVLKPLPKQSDDAEATDPMHIGGHKVGTPAPHKYWREDYAIKDLEKHNLPKPEHGNQHWVKMGTDYVLLNNETGTIQQIIQAE